MINKIQTKIKNNIAIYRTDLQTKGLYWSVVHRLFKSTKLRTILKPLVNKLKPEYIMIDGHKLYIDKYDEAISQELLQSKKWEAFETLLFKGLINKGDVVLDIGAHIGYYTLIAAREVGKNGKIYAFEPDKKNFNLLLKNIHANKYKNIIAINKAVTEKNGKIKLFINETNTGDHRIYDPTNQRKNVEITAIKLDSLFKNKHVDVIKMDIQGAEYNALKGAANVLKNNNTLKLITEFWPGGLRMNGCSENDFLQLLIHNKFKLYNIDEDKNQKKQMTAKAILKKFGVDNDAFTNLLCMR